MKPNRPVDNMQGEKIFLPHGALIKEDLCSKTKQKKKLCRVLLLQPNHQGGVGRMSWAGRLQNSEIWLEMLHSRHQCLVAFCLSRVEEIKWADWAKDVGVLKEEPGSTSDSEINPEGKLNHEERSALSF